MKDIHQTRHEKRKFLTLFFICRSKSSRRRKVSKRNDEMDIEVSIEEPGEEGALSSNSTTTTKRSRPVRKAAMRNRQRVIVSDDDDESDEQQQ